MFTSAQIAWIKSHDWYYAFNKSGQLIVFDRYTKDGVAYEGTIVWTKSFTALRNWAGY